MKPLFFVLALMIAAPAIAAAEKPLPLIPLPVSAERIAGSVSLATARIVLAPSATEAMKTTASIFADKVKARHGITLEIVAEGNCRGNILVGEAVAKCGREGELPAGDLPTNEGYRLLVADGVLIAAKTDHGIHNGFMTLLQLCADNGGKAVPGARVLDYPRFGWRGMLLDPARSFLPPEVIKKYLDIFAELKMTRLHWHLVDDQGWRIESKLYPRLHEVGGTDGYYTQEQLKEIVAFAADRHIIIVPEIDMPGHSTAMLVAYPNLACVIAPTAVRKGAGIFNTAMCPSKEEVYTFLDGFFGELAGIFPGEWVHIGSDEVQAKDWLTYPPNQELMKKEGLSGQDGLQSYFVRRVNEILRKHGKTMIAWDEVTAYLPDDAVVQAWRKHDFARAAAEKGHYSVVSPTSHCYIDYDQLQYTLKNLYGFEPLPPGLKAGDEKYILGAEVNLWGERVTLQNVDSKAFPRVVALAEITWSPAAARNWPGFVKRLAPVRKDMQSRGVEFGRTWRDILLLP